MFVLPGISAILPNSWGDSIDPYLPLSAGRGHRRRSTRIRAALSAWAGFLLFCGYAAGTLIVSAVLLVIRDA